MLATPALVRAIVDRSERYTSERDRLSSPVDPIGDLAARAVFFTPTDAMKIAIPLAELARANLLPPMPRVVDIGAGCGAMSLGLLTAVRPTSIVAIDRDAKALAIAKTAIATFGAGIETRVGDATTMPIPTCDLVLMGTVLNELQADDALAVVERALAAITDSGAVIIIEPALRDTSRALHAIRDAVLSRGGHVFAPCTRRIAPCTALADPEDWCHEDRPLALPPRTAELARLTHLRDSGMKFSYLVLRRAPADLAPEGAWRIVSAARITKGKLEVTACGERGRPTLRLLKRHRTADNKDLERVERGDIVITADPMDERIEIRAPIERIKL